MEIDQRVGIEKINHFFHHHTLIYRHLGSFYCNSCHKLFEGAPSYRCYECDFDLDVKCALMAPIACEGQEHIEHFSHQHAMPLVHIDPQHHIQCFACQSLCSGPTYACTTCEYFLHKSCAELPLLIQHPAHSFHPLFLRLEARSTCKICKKKFEITLIYGCKQCSNVFHICVKCFHENPLSLLRPSIKYRYHEHLLCFIEKYYDHIVHCKASDNYCHQPKASNDLHHLTNSVFLCLNCDFKIHFICGPLPSTIEHEYHMHPLSLVDSVVEANSDDYYCDVCEFQKNPQIRVYYCKECQYIAHPHCVISEIVKVFNGDLGGVKLKVIGQDFWEQPQEEEWDMSSSLTLFDLLSSNELDGGEKRDLNRWFKWDISSKGEDEDSKVEVADEDIIDEIITRYPFFNQQEDLTSFFFDEFGRFVRKEKLVVNSSDLSLKIVRVQGYSIPVTLAPVLQTLLHKYGDISPDYWTPAMKSICFFFLCKVRNSMHTTRFAHITKNLLRDWYYYLKFLSFQGFRIDFLMEPLTKVTRAFVGLQLARLQTEVPTKLNKKIVKLQQEIADLKAKEDICNKLFESSSDPKFIKDIFTEGAELKWKTVDQVLF
ncbi:hypothetical protein UlMin_009099 [Ulmus minor]